MDRRRLTIGLAVLMCVLIGLVVVDYSTGIFSCAKAPDPTQIIAWKKQHANNRYIFYRSQVCLNDHRCPGYVSPGEREHNIRLNWEYDLSRQDPDEMVRYMIRDRVLPDGHPEKTPKDIARSFLEFAPSFWVDKVNSTRTGLTGESCLVNGGKLTKSSTAFAGWILVHYSQESATHPDDLRPYCNTGNVLLMDAGDFERITE